MGKRSRPGSYQHTNPCRTHQTTESWWEFTWFLSRTQHQDSFSKQKPSNENLLHQSSIRKAEQKRLRKKTREDLAKEEEEEL